MADLTSDAPIRLKGEAKTEIFFIDTAAARTIYKGQPMMIDQNVGSGLNPVQFVDAVTVAATDVFVGIAAHGASVLISGPLTTPIEVYVGPSIVGFKSAVYANTDLGATVYMSDSGTLSATPTANVQIGTLFKVEDGYCYVQLTAPQICAGA
jgi:hypothetical protein